ARQRGQHHRFRGGEIAHLEVDTFAPRLELERAVEERAMQGLAAHEGVDAVRAGPVARRADESLFAAVSEDVEQPSDLRFGLVTDGDRLVPPGPNLGTPSFGAGAP